MRRLTFLVLAGAMWLLLGGSYAFADAGPHVMGAGSVADGCAGCHRTHTAKSSRLQAQTGICYTCHGSTGTGASTDVVDGLGYSDMTRTSGPGALRGGGFSYALINSAGATGQDKIGSNVAGTVPVGPSQPTTSNHTVDVVGQMIWGNGAIDTTGANKGFTSATYTFRCTSCHNAHGAGTYRALKPIPSSSGAVGGVSITDASTTPHVYTTTNYWQVEDAQAPSFIQNVSAWCSTCHTRYLAGTGAGSTSSTDGTYTYRHKSDGITQGTPNCIQCHVAHGSNAAVGTFSSMVKNPDGTDAPANDSRLLRIDNRGTCQMCHNR